MNAHIKTIKALKIYGRYLRNPSNVLNGLTILANLYPSIKNDIVDKIKNKII